MTQSQTHLNQNNDEIQFLNDMAQSLMDYIWKISKNQKLINHGHRNKSIAINENMQNASKEISRTKDFSKTINQMKLRSRERLCRKIRTLNEMHNCNYIDYNIPIIKEIQHPIIIEYESNFNGEIIRYFKLKQVDIELQLDTIKYVAVPIDMENIAIIHNIPNYIGNILNNQIINGLQLTVRDYIYPIKMQKITQQIEQFRTNTAEEIYRHYRLSFDDYSDVHNVNDEENKIINSHFDNNIDPKIEFKQYGGIQINNLIDPYINCKHIDINSEINSKEPIVNPLCIPSIFYVSSDKKVSIQTEINNLSKIMYNALYNIFESIFESMLPLFEFIVCDSLINKHLKVIVKMENIQLLPGKEYETNWCREGDGSHNIVAVGMYCYNSSQCITTDIFEISPPFRFVSKDINITPGHCIVFNNGNNIEHKLKKIKNASSTQIAVRKMLMFCLVNPDENEIDTSLNMLVNRTEYYAFFVTLYWFRKLFDKYLSIDLIKVIIHFMYAMGIGQKQKERTNIKIKSKVKTIQEMHTLLAVQHMRACME